MKEGVLMKRSVSLVASLVLMLGTFSVSACSEAPVGKDQLATICGEKGGSGLNCSCFTDKLQAELPEEQFARVAKAIEENRRFSGFLPATLGDDPSIGATIMQAQTSCAA
jgi:hypothetical protein